LVESIQEQEEPMQSHVDKIARRGS
jgi:hypothetical protein